jgi:hypothetical protein
MRGFCSFVTTREEGISESEGGRPKVCRFGEIMEAGDTLRGKDRRKKVNRRVVVVVVVVVVVGRSMIIGPFLGFRVSRSC